ncbi:hypothetical protein GSI_05129 [Ganoderma sinense ZZ0214-1]|uniref:Uncharacterized protein n=1 Tax=Ganoderma sinense ZZ0214-1 TaxID=1077348 RepID=A0A2G8SFF1_9APHY|nr:hypothetical protein GSI_05129 [Ganoderma sinense ZZ0214-1]
MSARTTLFSSTISSLTHWVQKPSTKLISTFTIYSFVPLGLAAYTVSLPTNLSATLLVAYKTWESRQRLWGHFVAAPARAQVQKLLALLIESGAAYCASALWESSWCSKSARTPGVHPSR